jgi:hypothetical protein
MIGWLVGYAAGMLVAALIAGAVSARYPRYDEGTLAALVALWPFVVVACIGGAVGALLMLPVAGLFGAGKAIGQRVWGVAAQPSLGLMPESKG